MGKAPCNEKAFAAEGEALKAELRRVVDALARHGGSKVFALPFGAGSDPYIVAAGPRSELLDMLPGVGVQSQVDGTLPTRPSIPALHL